MAPAAGLTGDETAFVPEAEPAAGEQQLAYSMADEGQPLAADEFGDEGDDFDDAGAELSLRGMPRSESPWLNEYKT